ncbi:MAG: septal ring lytic transglycosylase RlpA family protein [Actinomycetota bacterium]|nr:septal ring lytic transglycosylase RlpA family protein [Actinomycetota bacterium]
MRGRRLVAIAVLACLAAGRLISPALSSPASDVNDARERTAAVQADLDSLMTKYRDAAFAADDAAEESLRLRLAVQQARVAESESQSSYDDRVSQIYMAGPGVMMEVALGARTLADLDAMLPYVRESLTIGQTQVRELQSRHAATVSLAQQAESAERAAIAAERRYRIIREELESRVLAAERALQAAELAASKAAVAKARKSLFTIEHAAANWRELIDKALKNRRHARGEAAFAAASPYLGPRADCSIPNGLHPTGEHLAGEASWYGAGFAGRSTASGAVYDPRRYTVAHKTLPLGVFLLIKSDGRCVVSFLNDRGPYVEPRILDLSWASAQAVDLSGVEHVEAAVLVRS